MDTITYILNKNKMIIYSEMKLMIYHKHKLLHNSYNKQLIYRYINVQYVELSHKLPSTYQVLSFAFNNMYMYVNLCPF